jgi:hypothetical protein
MKIFNQELIDAAKVLDQKLDDLSIGYKVDGESGDLFKHAKAFVQDVLSERGYLDWMKKGSLKNLNAFMRNYCFIESSPVYLVHDALSEAVVQAVADFLVDIMKSKLDISFPGSGLVAGKINALLALINGSLLALHHELTRQITCYQDFHHGFDQAELLSQVSNSVKETYEALLDELDNSNATTEDYQSCYEALYPARALFSRTAMNVILQEGKLSGAKKAFLPVALSFISPRQQFDDMLNIMHTAFVKAVNERSTDVHFETTEIHDAKSSVDAEKALNETIQTKIGEYKNAFEALIKPKNNSFFSQPKPTAQEKLIEKMLKNFNSRPQESALESLGRLHYIVMVLGAKNTAVCYCYGIDPSGVDALLTDMNAFLDSARQNMKETQILGVDQDEFIGRVLHTRAALTEAVPALVFLDAKSEYSASSDGDDDVKPNVSDSWGATGEEGTPESAADTELLSEQASSGSPRR